MYVCIPLAILILAAVIKNLRDVDNFSSTFDKDDNIKFETAWAMVMSGVGGGFAGVVA